MVVFQDFEYTSPMQLNFLACGLIKIVEVHIEVLLGKAAAEATIRSLPAVPASSNPGVDLTLATIDQIRKERVMLISDISVVYKMRGDTKNAERVMKELANKPY